MSSNPSSQRTTLRSKILLGFGSVFLMLGIIATISVQSTRGFIRTADWVADAHEANEIEERMLRNLMEIESSTRGFLGTGDEAFLRSGDAAKRELERHFAELKLAVASDGGGSSGSG